MLIDLSSSFTASTNAQVTKIVEDDGIRPQSQYPISHAPPSTAPPSVVHVSADPPQPLATTLGDVRRQSIPPTVLGPSDAFNRSAVVVEDHPDGLLIKTAPSK